MCKIELTLNNEIRLYYNVCVFFTEFEHALTYDITRYKDGSSSSVPYTMMYI